MDDVGGRIAPERHGVPSVVITIGEADAELEQRLSAELDGFNAEAVRDHGIARELTVRATDPSGDLVAGVAGWTWGRAAGISMTWVRDEQRGTGVGTKAMLAFENEAKNRGADHVFVTSFTFQAPEFYQRLGYEEIFRWDGIPVPGHDDVHMRKSLDDTDYLTRSPANATRLREAITRLGTVPRESAAGVAPTQTSTASGHAHAHLRRASPADASGVLALWAGLFEGDADRTNAWECHARRWFMEHVEDTDEAFFPVIEHGDELVATAVGTLEIGVPNPFCPRGQVVRLANLITVEAHRHRGHGTSLIEAVVAWASHVGADRVDLSATAEGQRLYEKAGFQPTTAPRMKLMLDASIQPAEVDAWLHEDVATIVDASMAEHAKRRSSEDVRRHFREM